MPLVWLSNKWVIIAVLAFTAICAQRAAHYFDQNGYDRRSLEVSKEMDAIKEQAGRISSALQTDANSALKDKDAEIKIISDKLDAASSELRKRPTRRSQPSLPSSSGTCDGASGAELSRPDAGFLAGEAARGNQLRAALAQCYTQYKKVSEALNVK